MFSLTRLALLATGLSFGLSAPTPAPAASGQDHSYTYGTISMIPEPDGSTMGCLHNGHMTSTGSTCPPLQVRMVESGAPSKGFRLWMTKDIDSGTPGNACSPGDEDSDDQLYCGKNVTDSAVFYFVEGTAGGSLDLNGVPEYGYVAADEAGLDQAWYADHKVSSSDFSTPVSTIEKSSSDISLILNWSRGFNGE